MIRRSAITGTLSHLPLVSVSVPLSHGIERAFRRPRTTCHLLTLCRYLCGVLTCRIKPNPTPSSKLGISRPILRPNTAGHFCPRVGICLGDKGRPGNRTPAIPIWPAATSHADVFVSSVSFALAVHRTVMILKPHYPFFQRWVYPPKESNPRTTSAGSRMRPDLSGSPRPACTHMQVICNVDQWRLQSDTHERA